MPLWFVTPLATRRMQPQAQLKDCAPQDSEELKMITHDSGIHVIFTNKQKLGQIRNAIVTDGQFRNVNATAGSSENVLPPVHNIVDFFEIRGV